MIGTILYVGMMLLSAVVRSGIHSVVAMVLITGVIPLLAIATVWVIEGETRRRDAGPERQAGRDLRFLATRLRIRPGWRR